VVYGLDWIATVPPTARLCTDCFGKGRSAVLFGWCLAAHQVGAAIAAAGAGAVRTVQGTYSYAFWFSGALCVATSLGVLAIGRWRRPAQQPQAQPQSEELTAMPVVAAVAPGPLAAVGVGSSK
jgi:sugar phosphate permease